MHQGEQMGQPGAAGGSAAFFDVDNTMMVGASIYYLAKGLAARKFFSARDLFRFAGRQVRFRLSGESRGDMHSTRDSALAFVAGKSVAEIVQLGEEIYDESMAARIYPGTLALARSHLAAGEPVYLVTATPSELAQLIAARLELTGALGTVAETSEGRYTGRLVSDVLHGQAKADAVLALAEQQGYDLQRCSAYSDSINDMPMLSIVGRPVAVNPDSALRDEARARGWQIRDFRTGRRAARMGAIAGAAVGVATGGVMTTLWVRRRRPVSARPTGAAGAAGTRWPGWSRGPDRSARKPASGPPRRRVRAARC